MKKVFIFIILSIQCVLQLNAQLTPYKFSKLTIENGLSQNQITCSLKDSKGFIWVGTSFGLNRYDGYSVKIFQNNPLDSASINENYIYSLTEDHEGKMWVSTNFGFSVYNPVTEKFTNDISKALKDLSIPSSSITDIWKTKAGNTWYQTPGLELFKYDKINRCVNKVIRTPKDKKNAPFGQISAVEEDANGDVWLLSRSGILELRDGKDFRLKFQNYEIYNLNKGANIYYKIFLDKDNDLWIWADMPMHGVFYFDSKGQKIKYIHSNSKPLQISSNNVNGIIQDNTGLIWIGTNPGAINVLDKKTFSISTIKPNPNSSKSLSSNIITSLYKDNYGIIWIGTYRDGVAYYHENLIMFNQIIPKSTSGLEYKDVNCFAEDDKGNLWIGTDGNGLIYYNRHENTFTKVDLKMTDPEKFGYNVIVSLFLDKSKTLWIGTYTNGLISYDGKNTRYYTHTPSDTSSISNNRVWGILEDSQNQLWVATLGGGLELLNRNTGKFKHYKYLDYYDNHKWDVSFVSCLAEDKKGNILVGSVDGLIVLDKKANVKTHISYKSKKSKLSYKNVNDIFQDNRGLIWVSTSKGLNLIDENYQLIRSFTTDDGLPHNTIYKVLGDKLGNLWVSTYNGLSNICVFKNKKNEFTYKLRNYNTLDGLQGKIFSEKSGFTTKKGEMIFGGANGFNIFNPVDIKEVNFTPSIKLTSMSIFNRSVEVGEEVNNRIILNKAISETDTILLKYKENTFSLEFAALGYFHPEKYSYTYKLEGYDKDWMPSDWKQRKASYSNLDPGEYIFRVKVSINNTYATSNETSVKIKILPPFWKTKLAFVVYIFFILGLLFLSRQIILDRERLKYRIDLEKQKAQRERELDALKINFFTNISHEFRTPLTLIISPIENLIKKTNEQDVKQQLQLIFRNTKRLLALINQLLDFRKMEVGQLKLNPVYDDIVTFSKEVALSFTDISERKNIQFKFQSNALEFYLHFDKEKLEKIILNLLSNAFKFTPDNGQVNVKIRLPDKLKKDNAPTMVEIAVEDTGIGIAPDKKDKIFQPFFQAETPSYMINQGSGIGLAVTNEFVKLHGGEIIVESEPGKGSCFIVRLPINDVSLNDSQQQSIEENIEIQGWDEKSETFEDAAAPIILLVDDNEDFRFYLKDNLKTNYRILESANGKEAWKKTLSCIPDLIVSDVMMPETNGIEFCRMVKEDKRTCHIPVILLTAKASTEQTIEGLETGADDYIAKPFYFGILESRIKNLIQQREVLRKTFQKKIVIEPTDISITPLDEEFIQKALDLVDKNISNPDFSVVELSTELGISRAYLYKKILAFTGKSPIEFIRLLRIKRAAQLLKESQLNVSEIAYKVGFNNPKLFTKYFKDEFNVTPSQFEAKAKIEHDQDGLLN